MKHILIVIAVLFLIIPVSASQTWTVDLQNIAYNPQVLNIIQGDTVEWVWLDGTIHHSVTSDLPTSDPNYFDSALQMQPFTFDHTFINIGDYSYHCIVHGVFGMTGEVIVAPVPEPSPFFAFLVGLTGIAAIAFKKRR